LSSCAIASLPGGLPASPRQRVQEKLPIRIILEDNLAPVTPIHHVMERPRIFHPQLSRHAAKPGKQAFCVISRTDPFSPSFSSKTEVLFTHFLIPVLDTGG
jgi:hypothetical protein